MHPFIVPIASFPRKRFGCHQTRNIVPFADYTCIVTVAGLLKFIFNQNLLFMKIYSFLRSAFLISCFSVALGCQKEMRISGSNQEQSFATESNKTSTQKAVTRAYRDSFDVALGFMPDLQGGWTWADPDAPAWYPGTGNGNATHMGNVKTYFNTHTLRVEGTVMVYHARVGRFFATQVGQFNIHPEDEVSAVHYDDKGNSIWFKIAPEGLHSWHIDQTHVAMEGKMLIVGGTGKFAGATGETDFHAAFDQASWDSTSKTFKDASIWQNGWIQY